MSIAFIQYKRKFRNNLRPIFAMLQTKKGKIGDPEWELLVKKTIENVKLNPAEYLGDHLPPNTLIADVLSEIELEFFKEARTLSSE